MTHTPKAPAIAGLVMLAGGLALAVSAQAQQRPVTMAASSSVSGAETHAAALRLEALQLYGAPRQWQKVAKLHAEAARVAPVDDPERVQDLWMAAHLSYQFDRISEAQAYFEDAAVAALAFGDMPRAADAYYYASVMAVKRGAFDASEALLARVDLLAHSPLMPLDYCDCLESRIAQLSNSVAMLTRKIR